MYFTITMWKEQRDPSKCSRFLGELSNLDVDVGAAQEAHLTRTADWRVLEDDVVVLSVYCSRRSVGVFLRVGCSLNADVNLVFADDGDRLVVTNVAVKSFEFRVVAVYAPSIAAERVSFFRRLVPFLDDPKRIVLVVDWNAILDPKIGSSGELEDREGVKAAWSTWRPGTTWSIGVVWITQGGRS